MCMAKSRFMRQALYLLSSSYLHFAMASPSGGKNHGKGWTLQSSLEAVDNFMKGIGAKFTNLVDFRQAPSEKEPKTLYSLLAGTSLLPSIAARARDATMQFSFRSGIGSVLTNLPYILPGSGDRIEVAARFPFILATRGESARYLQYQPIWPPPLGTHCSQRLWQPKRCKDHTQFMAQKEFLLEEALQLP